MEVRTYAGWIAQGEWGDNIDALGLVSERVIPETSKWGHPYWPRLNGEPLVRQLSEDRNEYGAFVTIRYAISDHVITMDEAELRLLAYMDGDLVEYLDYWSDITGYLWTEQDLRIGGHDLMAELQSNVTRYCVMEVVYE